MRYVTITKPDIANGEGCRLSIWISGCNHKCPGCFNNMYWDYNVGHIFKAEDVIEKIKSIMGKPYINGISLLGGDPLDQSSEDLDELGKFLQLFRNTYSDKDIWLYSGDTYEVALQDQHKKCVIELCDVMVDGEFKIGERDRAIAFRGSKNQRIIDITSGNDISKQYDDV